MSNKKWTRKVDKKMKSYGDIDYDNRIIRINPSKGDAIDTALHEELHRKYPNKSEKWIRKKAKEQNKKFSIKKKVKLLLKYT